MNRNWLMTRLLGCEPASLAGLHPLDARVSPTRTTISGEQHVAQDGPVGRVEADGANRQLGRAVVVGVVVVVGVEELVAVLPGGAATWTDVATRRGEQLLGRAAGHVLARL